MPSRIKNKTIHKNIGDFEITDTVEKVIILKSLDKSSTLNNAVKYEIYKHNNNVYLLNKSTLSHYNLQSKQLKETIHSYDNISLYKLLGYFLHKNIQENTKALKKLKQSNNKYNKIMSSLNVGDVYYYTFFGYGIPCIKGYKIIEKNKASIKVQTCSFQKKITNKQIRYELCGTTGEETLIRIYKNQEFLLNGYKVHKLNKPFAVLKWEE